MQEFQKINEPVCSFCGKPSNYTGRMLSGMHGTYICETCVKECQDILSFSKEQNIHERNIVDKKPFEIKKYLDEFVIGQEYAKKVLAVAVYNHYKRIKIKKENNIQISKSNILLIGPTGCGKTYLTKFIAKILNVPYVSVDATAFTEAGYIGDNVENILLRLIKESDGNVEKAQRGIVCIDEIDKIAKKCGEGNFRDVSGEGVQQALLKMIEGTVVEIDVAQNNKMQKNQIAQIDTQDILFVFSGAFNGLDKIVMQRIEKNVIGFNTYPQHKETKLDYRNQQIIPEDLEKYGMIPEFVGRIPIIVPLNELTIDELKQVLCKPKNSIINEYKELFKSDNVDLQFEDEAIEEIAKIAFSKNNGARGLRGILEDILLETMYKIPVEEDREVKCIITLDTVRKNKIMALPD